jgi:hypothetical protein
MVVDTLTTIGGRRIERIDDHLRRGASDEESMKRSIAATEAMDQRHHAMRAEIFRAAPRRGFSS